MAGNAVVDYGWPKGCVAAAQQKQTDGGESKEDRVHGDDVIDDLRVGSGEGDQDSPDALKGDGDDRDVRAGMYPGDAAKKDAVFGHGEINARGGQDGLAEKAEGGEGDARGDERATARAQCRAHDGRGRRCCRGKSRWTESSDVHKIHGSVGCDEVENGENEAGREE